VALNALTKLGPNSLPPKLSVDELNVAGITTSGSAVVTGVTTSGAFHGNLVGSVSGGNISGNATGLTGSPDINVGTVVASGSISGGFIGNLTGDVTGNLNGNASGLSGTPNITVGTVNGNLSGNVTGDVTGNVTGNLTGVASSATALIDGANILTGNISPARIPTLNQSTSGTSGGLTGVPSIAITNLTGVAATFTGSVSVGGTLTYDDVTNIDSVGLITARSGIKVTSGSITIGSNSDLQIYHNPSTNHSYIDETGSGNLYIRNGSKNSIFARSDGEVILYNNDSNKLETTESGVIVSGVCTATSFVGSGASLTDLPAGGNSVDLVADGAIAAATPVIVTNTGKAKAIGEETSPSNPPTCSDLGGSRLYFSADIQGWIGSDYGADTPNNDSTGLTLNCWREPDNYIRYRFTHWTSNTGFTGGFSTGTISSSGDAYGLPIHCRYIGDGYWLVIWSTGVQGNGSTPVKCRTVRHNGDLGVENTLHSQTCGGGYFDAVRITDTRTVVTWRQLGNGDLWANDQSVLRVLDWSGSGTTRTFSGGTDFTGMDASVGAGQYPSLAYDSVNDRVLLMNWVGGDQKIRVGTLSGATGAGTITWGTVTDVATGASEGSVTYDATNNKIVAIWKPGGTSDAGALTACVITTSNSDNSVTVGTPSTSNTTINATDGMNSTAVSAEGLFTRAFNFNTNVHLKSLTVSGTTINWQSGSTTMSNTDSRYPIVNYNSKKKRFELFREKTVGDELYGSQADTVQVTTNVSTNNCIGFVEDAIVDGATGTVKLVGNTIDGYTSLSIGNTYWVQNDGTIGGGAATSQAGFVAISSTKGIIFT